MKSSGKKTSLYSSFAHVCVCKCVRGSDVESKTKEIEINWSEKVYNQQNVNNTTQVIILRNQFVTSSHGNYHDRHQFKFPSLTITFVQNLAIETNEHDNKIIR